MIESWFDTEKQNDLITYAKKLIPLGRQIEVKRGEFFYGNTAECLYIVKSGNLDKLLIDPSGNEIALFRLISHNFYGEMELFQGKKFHTVLQATNRSVLVEISGQALEKLYHDREFMQHLFQSATRKFRLLLVELGDARFNTVEGRLAHFLIRMAYNVTNNTEIHPGIRIEMPYTHEHIARRIRVHRSTISTIMADFKRRGLVRTDRRTITLLDLDGLRSLIQFNIED